MKRDDVAAVIKLTNKSSGLTKIKRSVNPPTINNLKTSLYEVQWKSLIKTQSVNEDQYIYKRFTELHVSIL